MATLTEAEQARLDELEARVGAAAPADAPAAPTASPAAADPMGNTLNLAPGAAPGSDPVGAVTTDIATGVFSESPGAIVRGVSHAIASAGHGLADAMDYVHKQGDGKPGMEGVKNIGIGGIAEPAMAAGARGVAWLGNKVADIFAPPKTVTGNLIQDVTQFTVGIIGVGKVFEMPALAEKAYTGVKVASKLFEGGVKNFAAAGVVFEGQQAKLSDTLVQYPALRNPVTEYLQSKPTDTEAEGRFKNALEGLGLGTSADLMFLGVKVLKYGAIDRPLAVRTAKEAEVLLDRLRGASEDAQMVPSTNSAPTNLPTVAGEAAAKVEPKAQAAAMEPGAKITDATVIEHPAPIDPDAVRSPDAAPAVEGEHGNAPYPVDAEHPAPYSVDAPMVPARDATGAVLPGNTLQDAAAVQEALNARWTVAGKEMAETQRFNPRTLNAPEDLHAMVNATTAVIEKNISKFVGGNADGVVTHKMTVKDAEAYIKKMAPDLADISGQSEANLIINIAQDAATMQGLVARLHAYKMIMMSVVNDAAENASKALLLDGSPEALTASANALHSAHVASQVLAMVKGIETNTARTMSAQRITKGLNSKLTENWGYQKIAQELEAGMKHTDDNALLKNLASLKDNPKGFNKYVEGTFGEKATGAFNSWYMNALLSSPKTHVSNFLSNTASTLYQPLERAVAGFMPASEISGLTAMRRMVDEYTGMGLGLMDSFRSAREAFKLGRSKLDPTGGTHVDPLGNNVDPLSARALGLSHDYHNALTGDLIKTDTTPFLSMFADGFSNTVNMPSRLLTTGDELFKQINYRGYLYSRAAEDARGLQLTGKGFSDHVSAKMDEGFASKGSNFAEGSATNKEGLAIAREATFTQPLDYGISRWVQGMSNEPGMGGVMTKLVVPFVRTPVNLMRFTWRHTPGLQAFETGFKRDWQAGGELRAKAQAQMVTGAGMFATAGYLAYSGAITGGHSLNPEVRTAEEATGEKEYSVKVGDNYYQFNRLDPFGTILGLAADFVKVSGHLSDFERDKMAYGMTLSLAKNLASKTYVQGLTNAFASLGDLMSGKSEIGFDTFAYRLAGSVFVPAVVNAFKGDDTLREIRSTMDSMKSRLPGASQSVPPVHNVLGEVVQQPKGWGSDAFSPIGFGTAKNDLVYSELARQMTQNEHPLNRIMPKLGNTNIDLREVTLEDGRNGYDRMQELLWQSGIKEELHDRFSAPDWKGVPDANPDYPMAEGTKLWETNKILEAHKQEARATLLAENPKLSDMYENELERSQGGDGPRDYIPPTLLQSILNGPKNRLNKK